MTWLVVSQVKFFNKKKPSSPTTWKKNGPGLFIYIDLFDTHTHIYTCGGSSVAIIIIIIIIIIVWNKERRRKKSASPHTQYVCIVLGRWSFGWISSSTSTFYHCHCHHNNHHNFAFFLSISSGMFFSQFKQKM